MRLATVRDRGAEHGAAVHPQRGLVLLADLEGVPGDVLGVIAADALDAVRSAADRAPDSAFRNPAGDRFGAPYRRPRKIWGIGLNYVEHAADLAESTPDEPASFLKGDHTIIGPDEPIPVPPQSRRTTAEAELGLVIVATAGTWNPRRRSTTSPVWCRSLTRPPRTSCSATPAS
jgi:2-keto-4-pentenoate hydratase/2-oxohepta-3-ene-1,7-dioic acid hydratase in catechol pathway